MIPVIVLFSDVWYRLRQPYYLASILYQRSKIVSLRKGGPFGGGEIVRLQ
jgi:hypothetical protein